MTDQPLDHAGMEVLGHPECLQMLWNGRTGRVGFAEAGEILILPVRYILHEGKILFRSAVGAKLDAALNQTRVAFEVDSWNEERRVGWSVLVQGTARVITDPREEEILAGVGLERWLDGPHPTRWIEIAPVEITGRRIQDSQPG
jgi:nitroimidazol reductase NimA-like FMN-containing flavoprotein (pyridoxamine 5'-phosphate oxidase superfamily)